MAGFVTNLIRTGACLFRNHNSHHGVLAERIFGVANFLPVLPSADTRVYLKKNFRFKVSSFDSSVVERLASMRGNPRSIPAHSKNIFCSESS